MNLTPDEAWQGLTSLLKQSIPENANDVFLKKDYHGRLVFEKKEHSGFAKIWQNISRFFDFGHHYQFENNAKEFKNLLTVIAKASPAELRSFGSQTEFEQLQKLQRAIAAITTNVLQKRGKESEQSQLTPAVNFSDVVNQNCALSKEFAEKILRKLYSSESLPPGDSPEWTWLQANGKEVQSLDLSSGFTFTSPYQERAGMFAEQPQKLYPTCFQLLKKIQDIFPSVGSNITLSAEVVSALLSADEKITESPIKEIIAQNCSRLKQITLYGTITEKILHRLMEVVPPDVQVEIKNKNTLCSDVINIITEHDFTQAFDPRITKLLKRSIESYYHSKGRQIVWVQTKEFDTILNTDVREIKEIVREVFSPCKYLVAGMWDPIPPQGSQKCYYQHKELSDRQILNIFLEFPNTFPFERLGSVMIIAEKTEDFDTVKSLVKERMKEELKNNSLDSAHKSIQLLTDSLQKVGIHITN